MAHRKWDEVRSISLFNPKTYTNYEVLKYLKSYSRSREP